MTYAFTFDSSACSGCKACQVACKDKNNLPVGVLWRRVYEVSGGSWTAIDQDSSRPRVWESDVFAYNLSIACNHCVHPKCAGVCPVDAYVIRADGIVYIDESKCMGCGYCSWACPYAAPQYHPELRHMTKCNFCFDNIDAGLPPACVAACPMRVLDFVSIPETPLSLTQEGAEVRALWELPASEHPFPLPEYSRTQPHLALKPHSGMLNELEKSISNREEIKPPHARSELPLVFFTLLVQMAVGAFWAAQWMFTPLWNLIQYDATALRLAPYLFIGASLGLGGFFSFAHLGAKKNAWRALSHLRKSWLSREILFVGLFGGGWAVSTLMVGMQQWVPVVPWLGALLGVGLVHAMAQVYRLKSVPEWNHWKTNLGFFVTSVLLGTSAMSVLLGLEVTFAGILLPPGHWNILRMLLFVAMTLQVSLILADRSFDTTLSLLRAGLLGVGFAVLLALALVPGNLPVWALFLLAVILWVEEVLGRWLFYEVLNERVM